MNTMRTVSTSLIVAATTLVAARGALAGGEACRAAADAAAADDTRVIDLAICLDTSGSMDGLIESAKQKLWAVVNDLALAEPTPTLRVALLTFGNDGHRPENGWVSTQTPFTEDLDLVSQKLFALKTNGGTELVGRVLSHAGRLDWHPSDDTLKLAIVAGNESADQDRERPFRDVCRELITQGIMINSIYCGPDGDDIAPAWREVALLADGQYASIDKDGGTVVIETPFDVKLAALSTAINETYIPYGAEGAAGAANQWAQDANAEGLNAAAAAQRCSTKTSALYVCGWDLVDACGTEEFKLEEVADAELPEAMRAMTMDQRRAYVAEKGEARAKIRTEVAAITAERAAFVEKEMKRRAIDDSNAFDQAVRKAIRAQAVAKGFRFSEPAKTADAKEHAANETTTP